MTARGAWPLWGAALALALLVVGAAGAAATAQGGSVDGFERGAAVLAGAGVVVLAFAARPAWPFSLGLALAVFSGHWGDMGVPIALDRVLLLSAIASVVVREAFGPGGLRTQPVHWLLAVVALYATVSAAVAGTLDDETARFALTDRFSLVAFALFVAAPFAFREARDRQVLLGTLVLLGAYLGVTAVLETTGPRGLLFPRYIDDPTVGIHFDRARGPFTESVGNGLVLFTCGVAGVLGAVTWAGRRVRVGAGVVAVLCLLGTLLTLTRAVWLGAIVATVLALVLAREARRFLLPVLLLGAVLVAGAFVAIPGFHDRAVRRTNDDRPLWDRKNSNDAALRMLAQKPTLGFGWGRFQTDSVPYYRQAATYPLTFVLNVHNVYLANAVELGVLGGALWLVALLTAIVGGVSRRGPPGLRPWKLGLVAVAACYLVAAATTPLAFTLPTLLLWTWAGIAYGAAPEPA